METLELSAAQAAAAEAAYDLGIHPVNIANTRLRSGSNPDEPANVEMDLRPSRPVTGPPLTEDSAAAPSRWLLAESWWAQEFNPPPARTLLRWVLVVAPTVVLGHIATSTARYGGLRPLTLRRCWGVLVCVMQYLLALIVLALLVVALLALLLLASIPIPRLSAFARRVGAMLATSVGDSYILVASPTEYDAMVSRVERDVGWLAARCDRVAVVAHSQGAVIAHRALARSAPENVVLFVTVGSGLSKLSEIATIRLRTGSQRTAWFTLAFVLMGLGFAAWFWWAFGRGRFAASFGGGLALIYLAMSLWMFFQIVSDRAHEQIRRGRALRTLAAGSNIDWVDFYASADPVPNGPLFTQDPEWLRSYQTWFESSWLADHAGYRSNADGFIAPLVTELARAADNEVGRLLGDTAQRVLLAARRRSWRCAILVRVRIVLAISVAIALPQYWARLESVARSLREATPEVVKQVLQAVARLLPIPKGLSFDVNGWLAATLASLAGLTLFALATAIWRWLGARDLRRFYAGRAPDFGGPPIVVLLAAVAAIAVVAVGGPMLGLLPSYDRVAVEGFVDLFVLVVAIPAMVGLYLRAIEARNVPDGDFAHADKRKEQNFQQTLLEILVASMLGLPIAFAAILMLRLPPDGQNWLNIVVVVVVAVVVTGECWLIPKMLPAARRAIAPIHRRWLAASVRQRGARDAAWAETTP